MHYHMNAKKAVEAAATLLSLVQHKTMGRKRLLALLYLADREAVKRTGRPIVGGRLAALKHGPIHSDVYDLIKGGHYKQSEWNPHFENDDWRVKLTQSPSIQELSRFEINLLNEVSAKYAGLEDWDLAEHTHTFNEYKSTYVENTSTPIPFEQIIEAVGRSKDKEAIIKKAEEKAFFDKLFAGAN